MSRYVRLDLPLHTLSDVRECLERLKIPFEAGPVALEGTFECSGEPVALRLLAGSFDAVQDFGFVADPTPRLVCGELDRRLLAAELLPRLVRDHVDHRLHLALRSNDLEIERVTTDERNRRRIILKSRS